MSLIICSKSFRNRIQRQIDQLTQSLSRLHVRGGKKILVTNSPSGYYIEHEKDMFYAEIMTTDSTGEEADYTDERYWVKEQYNNNSSGDNTDAVTFTARSSPLWVTATNTYEISGGTHDLDSGIIVQVWTIKDVQTSPVTRYIFSLAV